MVTGSMGPRGNPSYQSAMLRWLLLLVLVPQLVAPMHLREDGFDSLRSSKHHHGRRGHANAKKGLSYFSSEPDEIFSDYIDSDYSDTEGKQLDYYAVEPRIYFESTNHESTSSLNGWTSWMPSDQGTFNDAVGLPSGDYGVDKKFQSPSNEYEHRDIGHDTLQNKNADAPLPDDIYLHDGVSTDVVQEPGGIRHHNRWRSLLRTGQQLPNLPPFPGAGESSLNQETLPADISDDEDLRSSEEVIMPSTNHRLDSSNPHVAKRASMASSHREEPNPGAANSESNSSPHNQTSSNDTQLSYRMPKYVDFRPPPQEVVVPESDSLVDRKLRLPVEHGSAQGSVMGGDGVEVDNPEPEELSEPEPGSEFAAEHLPEPDPTFLEELYTSEPEPEAEAEEVEPYPEEETDEKYFDDDGLVESEIHEIDLGISHNSGSDIDDMLNGEEIGTSPEIEITHPIVEETAAEEEQAAEEEGGEVGAEVEGEAENADREAGIGGESASHVSTNPEVQPSGEPSVAEGEGESEPEKVSPEAGGFAEPNPDWEEAKMEWGAAWEVHIYSMGIAFAVLAIYSFISIIRLWRHKNLLSQGYFITLNFIMLLMGFFRAVFLLIDAYNSNATFHPIIAYFFWSISFPCITSAFSILFLALLQTTRMQLVLPQIYAPRVLVAIIVTHFGFSLLTDIIVGQLVSAKMMLLVCQVMTIVWGLLLFSGYIYIFKKLYVAAVWRQKELSRQTTARLKLNSVGPVTKKPKLTLGIAIKVTMLTSVLGLVLAALQIYGVSDISSIFETEKPDIWAWWGYQFGMRLVELAMCILMSYVATQPFRFHQSTSEKKWTWSGAIYLAPCRRLCDCTDDEIRDSECEWYDIQVDGHNNQVEPMTHTLTHIVSAPMRSPDKSGGHMNPIPQEEEVKYGQEPMTDEEKRNTASRPASLLVNDNGFIRFRQDGEEGNDVLLSTDDELENDTGVQNPFLSDLQRRGLVAENVNREYFIGTVHLPEDYRNVDDSSADPSIQYDGLPPLQRYVVSLPNTGDNTPGTPHSFCSTEFDKASGMWSFRPPSSIHLRDSIENALNYPDFNLRTPDNLDSPTDSPQHNRHLLHHARDRLGRTRHSIGSLNDLQNIRSGGHNTSHYLDAHQSVDAISTGRCSPDDLDLQSMKSATSGMVRSRSESLTSIYYDPYTGYAVERRAEASGKGADRDTGYESVNDSTPSGNVQMQDILRDINAMCTAIVDITEDNGDITHV